MLKIDMLNGDHDVIVIKIRLLPEDFIFRTREVRSHLPLKLSLFNETTPPPPKNIIPIYKFLKSP